MFENENRFTKPERVLFTKSLPAKARMLYLMIVALQANSLVEMQLGFFTSKLNSTDDKVLNWLDILSKNNLIEYSSCRIADEQYYRFRVLD